MNTPRIVRCVITHPRGRALDMSSTVSASFDNDPVTLVKLFDFYHDELSFSEGEFIGKTRAEAGQIRLARDVAYLQS